MCSFPVVNKIAHVEDLSASQALCWPFKPPPPPQHPLQGRHRCDPLTAAEAGVRQVRKCPVTWFTTGGQRCRPTWASRADSQLPRVHFLTSWSEDVCQLINVKIFF